MSNEGSVSSHARDAKHMRPEVARVDALQFDIDVDSDGLFTQPVKQAVPGNYISSLEEIRGHMQAPLTKPELASTIYFNIRDQSQQGVMFSNKIMMAHLVSGAALPLKFDKGIYVFGPGADIEVTFSVDGQATIGYAALADAAKRWSLLLTFSQFTP